MTAKQAVACKVTPERKAALEKAAKAKGTTISELLLEGFDNAGRIHFLEAKLRDVQSQLGQLESKYEQATGHRPTYAKKITVPVTAAEHRLISKAALEAGMHRGQFIRSILSGQQKIPALESR